MYVCVRVSGWGEQQHEWDTVDVFAGFERLHTPGTNCRRWSWFSFWGDERLWGGRVDYRIVGNHVCHAFRLVSEAGDEFCVVRVHAGIVVFFVSKVPPIRLVA